MSPDRVAVLVLACCVGSSPATHARAEEAASETAYVRTELDRDAVAPNPTAAEVEFARGRELLRDGDDVGACTAFERSRQLNTSVAVLLNLGLCHHRLGRVTTAFRCYRRAEVLAALNGDPRRELAHEEAAKLAGLRAVLVLRMTEPNPNRIAVQIDGIPQPVETWSQPMFVDAGDHTVTVLVEGAPPWHGAVKMQDGKQQGLIVPRLTPELAPRTAIPAGAAPVKRARDELPSDPGPPTSKVVAIVVGGAGVVSLGVGLVFGVLAQSEQSDSNRYCEGEMCDPPGLEHRRNAIDHATRSTVLSIAGAAAIAAGVVVWLTAPASAETPPVTVHTQVRGIRVVASL